MSIAKHWRVEVHANGEQLVAIETEMLSGKPDLSHDDLDTIRNCAEHLLCFAGNGEPYLCFYCGGDGEVRRTENTPAGHPLQVVDTCPICGPEVTPNARDQSRGEVTSPTADCSAAADGGKNGP